MKQSTKKRFTAPWHAEKQLVGLDYEIKNSNGTTLAVTSLPNMARRTARLPELYDAFVDAIKDHCAECDPASRAECEACKWYAWSKLLKHVELGE